jgi:hypothetical protein
MMDLGAEVAKFRGQFLNLSHLRADQRRVFLLHGRKHLRHRHVALLELLHHLAHGHNGPGERLRDGRRNGRDRINGWGGRRSPQGQLRAVMSPNSHDERHPSQFEQVAVANPSQARAPAIEDRSLPAHRVNQPNTV